MKKQILTTLQINFLTILSKESFSKRFYLTGGTALAGFYFNHRYSEDLDFFCEEEINLLELNIFFKKVQKQLFIKKIDFQQSLNRNIFFCFSENEVLKTEFTYFPFPRIEKGKCEYGVELDSILDIAVNKLFTIYHRSVARDYIDLYYLCKEKGFLIIDLIALAKAKFDRHIDPLQLGCQFSKASDALDFPVMIRKANHKKWKNFFYEEAMKFKEDILS